MHFGAGRSEIKFDTIRNVSAPAAHNFRGVMQIFETRVHAREQICFLNGHAFSFHFRQRYHRFDFVRPRHVRNHRREIKLKLDGILRVRVGAEFGSILPPRVDVGVGVAGTTLRAASSRSVRIGERRDARAKIVHCYLIKWEYTREGAPLGGHVGDSHTRGHREVCYAITHKFYSVIEHFIFVEEPAQGNDHVLANDAR